MKLILFLLVVSGIYLCHCYYAERTELNSYGCVCKHFNCGCCAHLEVPKVGLNDTGCVNLTYLPKEYGISFTMTIDNLTIYNETVSARNPPPICFGAPMLKEFAELCVHFYDLKVSRTKAHGCVQLEARLHKVVIASYKIGCFDVGNILWKKYHVHLIDRILEKQRNRSKVMKTSAGVLIYL